MRHLFLLLPATACYDDTKGEDPLCESAPCSEDSGDSQAPEDSPPDEHVDDSFYVGGDTGETGDTGDDTSAPTGPEECGDATFSADALVWERSEVELTWTSSDLTCSAVAFDDWELVLEWSVPTISGFLMNPVVAPQDGATWSTVFVEYGGFVDLYDGRDGALIETIDFGGAEEDGSTPAVGDADGDGDLEFVTTTYRDLRIVDLGTGTVTAASYLDPRSPEDEVSSWVDANEDGDLDVLLMGSTWTLDGDNIAAFDGGLASTGRFAADLDQDGEAEVVNSSGIFSAADGDGVKWDPSQVSSLGYALYGGPVLVEDDVRVWFNVGSNTTYLADLDAFVVSTMSLGGEHWLASIGDVDGDAAPEMCVFDEGLGAVVMLNLAGDALWTWTVGPYLSSGGCSMADLDGDGLYEVVLSTWYGLAVLDGATGVALEEVPDTETSARDSAPAIADIDGDGSAEIIWSNGNSLAVYGAASGSFARTRPVWNQLGYDITSIQDDGTLVSWPRPSWEAYNAYRAQPAHDGESPDLDVEVLDTCVDDCETGTLGLLVRVGNRGSVEAAAGAVLRLYTVDEDGPRELASLELDEALASGSALEAWIWVYAEDLGARIAVDVSAADEDECDQVNNRQMVRSGC